MLLLQGGDGDANGTEALAEQLIDRYTVLSYDRRGLSRSPIDDPSARVELAAHATDAAALIDALADAPVLAFGSSLGALIGLELVSRHPELVRALVAHEPPATELLPDRDRRQAVSDQEEVEDLYRRDGISAAMRKFAEIADIDPSDREPSVAIPLPSPGRLANLEFFLAHDAPAAHRYRLDLEALHAARDVIFPAAGRTSRGFPHACVRGLACELGRPLAKFPGGHSGFVFHPRAFAAKLDELLTSAVVRGRE